MTAASYGMLGHSPSDGRQPLPIWGSRGPHMLRRSPSNGRQPLPSWGTQIRPSWGIQIRLNVMHIFVGSEPSVTRDARFLYVTFSEMYPCVTHTAFRFRVRFPPYVERDAAFCTKLPGFCTKWQEDSPLRGPATYSPPIVDICWRHHILIYVKRSMTRSHCFSLLKMQFNQNLNNCYSS